MWEESEPASPTIRQPDTADTAARSAIHVRSRSIYCRGNSLTWLGTLTSLRTVTGRYTRKHQSSWRRSLNANQAHDLAKYPRLPQVPTLEFGRGAIAAGPPLAASCLTTDPTAPVPCLFTVPPTPSTLPVVLQALLPPVLLSLRPHTGLFWAPTPSPLRKDCTPSSPMSPIPFGNRACVCARLPVSGCRLRDLMDL